MNIAPRRSLEDDLQSMAQVLSYDSSVHAAVTVPVAGDSAVSSVKKNSEIASNPTSGQTAEMKVNEKVRRNLEKLDRIFG